MGIRSKSQVLARPAAGTFLALLLVLAAGCGDYEMDSLWLGDSEIVIDGNSSDWRGSLYYLDDEKASIGIKNDAEHLYLCLITQEPTRSRQAVSRGLILWFDPSGGKEKKFGINYPLGAGAGMRPGPGQRGQVRDPEKIRENREAAAAASLEELKFLDANGQELNLMKVEELTGMEIAAESTGGMFIYELKVPLRTPSDLPSVLGAQPGRILSIGLEIPKMDMPSMRGSRPGGGMGGRPGGRGTGGMPGGGMGGGGRSGMGGGGRGGLNPDMSKGMKLWSKVLLATG
jgi:hypothetical protein